jgi:hypothetical protein
MTQPFVADMPIQPGWKECSSLSYMHTMKVQPVDDNELDAWKDLTSAIISSRVGGELNADRDFTTLANSQQEGDSIETTQLCSYRVACFEITTVTLYWLFTVQAVEVGLLFYCSAVPVTLRSIARRNLLSGVWQSKQSSSLLMAAYNLGTS